jgi:2-oxoglutarate dehydrogenase complex, dehydrogenase (E1) component, and related enzymes
MAASAQVIPDIETARFRASSGQTQGFGTTPQEALQALLSRLPNPAAVSTPIIIWPFNQGDSFFSDAQQARLQELKARRNSLSPTEQEELERLVEAAFDATVARTQSLQNVKS